MRWLSRAVVCACMGAAVFSGSAIFSGAAVADPQYWIVVGSFRDLGNADASLSRANAMLSESFAIVPIKFGVDRRYRILAGPYATPEVADLGVTDARQAGFADSWMFANDPTDDYTSNYTDDDFSDYANDYTSDYTDYAEDSAAEYGELSGSRGRPEVKSPRKVVEAAPDGYALHKLQR